MGYYDSYGSNEDVIGAIDNATQTMNDVASLWSSYSSSSKDRELKKYMFEKQLEWNSPKSQMERYREAGLNPFIGHSISAGNMDSLPDLGPDPLSAAAEGFSRMADSAIKRLSSRTAVQEAKMRLMQVNNEIEKLSIQKDLFPVQRRMVESQLENMSLTNEFLGSSLPYRLKSAIQDSRLSAANAYKAQSFMSWLSDSDNFSNYWDELFNSTKVRNSYTRFLEEYGKKNYDLSKDRFDLDKIHWDVINDPFGFGVGSSNVNIGLNALFSILRLIFSK